MRRAGFGGIYVALLILRLYFALSQSYIHPDEMFQGSEIVVGDIFGWQTIRTWEFIGPHPIRSIVPVYLFQAPALYLLRLMDAQHSTRNVFYALRTQQYLWSIVLDGLVYITTRRKTNLILFATSYVTMTYHTHTFSNSWESILVLLTLHANTNLTLSLSMGLLAALGIFTRPSFIFFMLPLASSRLRRTFVYDDTRRRTIPNEPEIQFLAFSATLFSFAVLLFVSVDTFYYSGRFSFASMWSGDNIIVTVLNNLAYNSKTENLAQHGLHPRYLHIVNASVLLGPSLLLAFKIRKSIQAASMVSGFIGLSLIPHQEARFLLPCTVLFFTSLRVTRLRTRFWTLWILFNGLASLIFGKFHQSGVIPSSFFVGEQFPYARVTYTKCYPAPVALLGPHVHVSHGYGDSVTAPDTELVVTPLSNDHWNRTGYDLIYQEAWHVNMDDFDTLQWNVFKHRGMGVFKQRLP